MPVLHFFMRMQMAVFLFHGFMLMIMMAVFVVMPVFVNDCLMDMYMNVPLAYRKICPRRHYN